jgi:hypothetical protein
MTRNLLKKYANKFMILQKLNIKQNFVKIIQKLDFVVMGKNVDLLMVVMI